MKRSRISIDTACFPEEIRSLLPHADVYDSSSSDAARVYYIDGEGGLFLKRAPVGALGCEAAMTGYFHSLGLSAEVLSYASSGGYDWLLTRRVPGEDCVHPDHLARPERLCGIMGEQLRRLHDIDPSDCPVPDRLDTYNAGVASGLAKGIYAPKHFMEVCPFSSPQEVRACAKRGLSLLKSDALIHGDYCLPNIMLDGWEFSGFIDLGSGGVADRHIDVFWGIWSLNYNLHTTRYADRFLDAYGRDRIDPELLRCVAAMEIVSDG